MGVAVGITALLMLGATAGRRIVPTRIQSVAELSYEFVADTIRNIIGEEGMRFFPLVFSIFMFILVTNMVGLIPYNQAAPSGDVAGLAVLASIISVPFSRLSPAVRVKPSPSSGPLTGHQSHQIPPTPP